MFRPEVWIRIKEDDITWLKESTVLKILGKDLVKEAKQGLDIHKDGSTYQYYPAKRRAPMGFRAGYR